MRSGERGQAVTAVVVAVTLLLLGVGFLAFVKYDKATDQASNLQTAADATALAAAQQIAKDAPSAIIDALLRGRGLSGLGQDAANDFAGRGGASVISYHYYPDSDRVEVTVQSQRKLESGRQETRSAVARTGMRLGPCRLPDAPTPTPTPTPPPAPSPSSSTSGAATPSPTTSTPPPDTDAVATCGDVQIPITFPGDGDPVQAHPGRVVFHFEPRLSN
ncbi:pilus assembly protein TadG-related protein [Branchiibius sp. NY16-3462-2]|uniref:pilus assembly protein TadG-related protein n=1 Tax=Branchiibius sp. NY16-3462-2 TaxID=1807500 RepID=UPI000798F107|nr:pilus assembly protein TadG-related protein [Branchiibius sp. NY16-3462-2]KYH45603.1 hypothetical protein AZH51_17940 [Branchiibius sp. NY16-3462-2]